MDHARPAAAGDYRIPVLVALTLALLTACSSNWVRWEDRQVTHTVKSGDTLHQIAFRHQLDYRDLAWWNGIGRSDKLYPGQVLRLDPPLPGELRDPPKRVYQPGTGKEQRPKPSQTRKPVRQTQQPSRSHEPVVPRRWQWPAKGPILETYNIAQGRKGLDIGGRIGDSIQAAADGKVVYAGNALKGYGQLIIIKHNEDYLTAYGHNEKLLVREGDQVKLGQPIATMGSGPQNRALLHFEIRRLGKPVNPMPLLPKR